MKKRINEYTTWSQLGSINFCIGVYQVVMVGLKMTFVLYKLVYFKTYFIIRPNKNSMAM